MERLIKDYFLVTVLLLLNYIDEVVDSGFNVMGFVPILLLGIYNYSIYKTTTHRSARPEVGISDDYSYDVAKKAFKWDPGSLVSSPVFIYTLFLGVELLQEGRQRSLAIFFLSYPLSIIRWEYICMCEDGESEELRLVNKRV